MHNHVDMLQRTAERHETPAWNEGLRYILVRFLHSGICVAKSFVSTERAILCRLQLFYFRPSIQYVQTQLAWVYGTNQPGEEREGQCDLYRVSTPLLLTCEQCTGTCPTMIYALVRQRPFCFDCDIHLSRIHAQSGDAESWAAVYGEHSHVQGLMRSQVPCPTKSPICDVRPRTAPMPRLVVKAHSPVPRENKLSSTRERIKGEESAVYICSTGIDTTEATIVCFSSYYNKSPTVKTPS